MWLGERPRPGPMGAVDGRNRSCDPPRLWARSGFSDQKCPAHNPSGEIDCVGAVRLSPVHPEIAEDHDEGDGSDDHANFHKATELAIVKRHRAVTSCRRGGPERGVGSFGIGRDRPPQHRIPLLTRLNVAPSAVAYA